MIFKYVNTMQTMIYKLSIHQIREFQKYTNTFFVRLIK